MRYLLLVLIVMLSSCSKPKKKSKHLEGEIRTTVKVQQDSIELKNNNPEADSTQVTDTELYIGFVNKFYFANDNEIYTELYFNRSIDSWEEYDSISKLTEEIIYQDQENSRNLLSRKIAEENFDLNSLEKLWLFDSNNMQLEASTQLKNIEFFEQNISPVFIAVYQPQIKIEDIAYCIGGIKPTFDDLNIKEIEDQYSIKKIEDYFKNKDLHTTHTLKHQQYSLNDSIVITVSNTNDYSFIHKTKKDITDIIYEIEDFNIINFQIIPILKNEMPILLCHFLKPDSDIDWSEVLVYNGDKYIASEHQKVKLNDK